VVTATTAGPLLDTAACPGVGWSVLERDHMNDLRGVVNAGTDVVVDVTAFTPAHAQQLLELGDRIGSAIVLPTLSVYTDSEGRSRRRRHRQ
jgi:hypothetical protein